MTGSKIFCRGERRGARRPARPASGQAPFAAALAGGLLFLVLLGGCGTGYRAAPTPAAGAGQAAASLQTEGEALLAAGSTGRAEAVIERAIRIDPENPRSWYAMAQVRQAQGRYSQAVQCCLRSLALLPEAHPLRRNCWQLMAQAYAAMGDEGKAREAAARARNR